jgi:hypothetical protein
MAGGQHRAGRQRPVYCYKPSSARRGGGRAMDGRRAARFTLIELAHVDKILRLQLQRTVGSYIDKRDKITRLFVLFCWNSKKVSCPRRHHCSTLVSVCGLQILKSSSVSTFQHCRVAPCCLICLSHRPHCVLGRRSNKKSNTKRAQVAAAACPHLLLVSLICVCLYFSRICQVRYTMVNGLSCAAERSPRALDRQAIVV